MGWLFPRPFISGVKNIQYIIMIINCLAKYCLADCTELMGGSGGMLWICSLNYKNSGDFCSLKYKNRMLFCSLKYKLLFWQLPGYGSSSLHLLACSRDFPEEIPLAHCVRGGMVHTSVWDQRGEDGRQGKTAVAWCFTIAAHLLPYFPVCSAPFRQWR